MMVSMVIMLMRGLSGRVSASAPEHPDRQRENEQPREKLKIGLGGLDVPLRAKAQGQRGQRPDDQRVGDGRRQAEQGCLRDGAAHGDDESRHHRLGMPGLQAMQGAQHDGRRNEEPGIGGALIEEFLK
jgi:hypothetical protein